MNAEQARELTNNAQAQIKITLFDCLIAIKQAAKNGDSCVTVSGLISDLVKDQLEANGFRVRVLPKAGPSIDKTEINW